MKIASQRLNEFFFKYKKDLIFIFFLVVLDLLFLTPLLLPKFIQGHDSLVQLASAAARIEAIRDGQFPVRWAGDLNFGYGNPSFIFYYSLGGYLVSILFFLGINLETSYELLLALCMIFGSIFFYLWVSQNLKKDSAFIGAMFYALSPYLLLDIYVRSHLGESLSLALVPLVLLFIEKNLRKFNLINTILGAFAFFLLVHSHGILSLIFSFVFVFYILFRVNLKIKLLFLNLLFLVFGLILSSYSWIPILLEGKHINSQLFLLTWYKDHFVNIAKIIYSPWGFGSNVNEMGGQAPQVGLIHFLFAGFGMVFLIKKKNIKEISFWFLVFLIGIFMSTKYAIFLYDKFHVLQKFEFPWRFISLTSISSSVILAYFFSIYNNKKIKIIAILLLIFTAIPMIRVSKSQSYGNNFYFNYNGTTTYHNEATTIWVDGDASKSAKRSLEIIAGQGEILSFNKKSNVHQFSIDNESEVKILDNTVYFPGWRAEVDGKKVPIEFQDQNHRGLITFNIPKGEHEVKVKFGESPIRLISDVLSLIGALSLLVILFFRKWVTKKLKT